MNNHYVKRTYFRLVDTSAGYTYEGCTVCSHLQCTNTGPSSAAGSACTLLIRESRAEGWGGGGGGGGGEGQEEDESSAPPAAVNGQSVKWY